MQFSKESFYLEVFIIGLYFHVFKQEGCNNPDDESDNNRDEKCFYNVCDAKDFTEFCLH